jgi:septal ring factor EnvC (AmiA/AmiB activator)
LKNCGLDLKRTAEEVKKTQTNLENLKQIDATTTSQLKEELGTLKEHLADQSAKMESIEEWLQTLRPNIDKARLNMQAQADEMRVGTSKTRTTKPINKSKSIVSKMRSKTFIGSSWL